MLSQMEEFWDLEFLFTSEGRGERGARDWQMHQGMAAVMQTLYWSLMVKRELSLKANRLQILVPKSGFHHGMAGLCLADRLRNSVF